MAPVTATIYVAAIVSDPHSLSGPDNADIRAIARSRASSSGLNDWPAESPPGGLLGPLTEGRVEDRRSDGTIDAGPPLTERLEAADGCAGKPPLTDARGAPSSGWNSPGGPALLERRGRPYEKLARLMDRRGPVMCGDTLMEGRERAEPRMRFSSLTERRVGPPRGCNPKPGPLMDILEEAPGNPALMDFRTAAMDFRRKSLTAFLTCSAACNSISGPDSDTDSRSVTLMLGRRRTSL